MDRTALRVFIRSATSNWRAVSAACLLDASSLVLSAAFSALLALYFGFDVFDVSAHPLIAPLVSDRTLLVLVAFVTAVLLLVARVLATLLDSHVVFSRELWLARRIRGAAAAGTSLSPKTVPRASSHFGRLSLASMNASSAVLVLVLNALLLPILLPAVWAGAILGLTLLCILLFGLLFIELSKRMQNAMVYMLENAGVVSRWKVTPNVEDPAELAFYSKAYALRIFLSSIFSYAPALLAVLFTVALFVAAEVGHAFDFGQIFVAFVLAQTYLGLVARLFNSALKASAFAPSVAPHADIVLSDRAAPAIGPASSQDVARDRATAARERDDEMLSLDE